MRIINTHTHLIDTSVVLAEDQLHYLNYIKGIPTFSDLDNVIDMLSLDNLLAQMDEANVEKSVLFAVDGPLLTASNQFVADVCNKMPDRFYGFEDTQVDSIFYCTGTSFNLYTHDSNLTELWDYPPSQTGGSGKGETISNYQGRRRSNCSR